MESVVQGGEPVVLSGHEATQAEVRIKIVDCQGGRGRNLSSHFGRGRDVHSSKYSIQAVLKKEAFNLVVSDKISYTREVGSYSNVWLNEMLIK